MSENGDSLGLGVAREALKRGFAVVVDLVEEGDGKERGLTMCASELLLGKSNSVAGVPTLAEWSVALAIVGFGEGIFSSLFSWGGGEQRSMWGGLRGPVMECSPRRAIVPSTVESFVCVARYC